MHEEKLFERVIDFLDLEPFSQTLEDHLPRVL